jgi:N-acetylglutamate synthase/N-acetylornithine aminotransferase
VDGDTSTNDMCVVLANGMAGNPLIEWKDEGFEVFSAALYAVCEHLAKCIAADGEGASRLIACTVHHARNEESAERLSKAVVGSSLVKAAMFRRRRQLGPRAVRHGILQSALPSGICGYQVFLGARGDRGGAGRARA